MKIAKPITALVLLSASALTPVANAHDSALQSVVSKMLSSALAVTVDELQNQTTRSVANAAHHISNQPADVAASVKITELTPEQASSNNAKQALTKPIQSSKSE